MELKGGYRTCKTMRTFLLLYLVCMSAKKGCAHQAKVEPNERLLFVFGDSYADTGNAPPVGGSWSTPYGVSWPGTPTGRFSDGKIQTDFLAKDVLGIQPPPCIAETYGKNTSILGGINFAVAGSGVMLAFGTPPLRDQIDWFAAYVQSGLFGSDILNKAVFFVCVSGNDYAAYNGTLEGYLPLVSKVVDLIDRNLRDLYFLGGRNFMVPSIGLLGCVPARTFPTGYTSCPKNETVDQVISAHNYLLEGRLNSIQASLEGSNIIYLQQTKALEYVLNNTSAFGLTEGLKPCCAGVCGLTDPGGNLLYSVCLDPEKHLFWDYFHPTQAAWRAVVDLYLDYTGFTEFSPSLRVWAERLKA